MFNRFAMADNAKLVAASASPPAQVAAPASSPTPVAALLPSPPAPVAALQTALLNVQRIASEMMEVPGALIDMPLALNVVVEALGNVVVMFQCARVGASLRAATTGLTFVGSSLQLCLQSGAVTHHDTVVAAALKAAAASFLAASSALEAEGADAMAIVIELQSVADLLNALDVR